MAGNSQGAQRPGQRWSRDADADAFEVDVRIGSHLVSVEAPVVTLYGYVSTKVLPRGRGTWDKRKPPLSLVTGVSSWQTLTGEPYSWKPDASPRGRATPPGHFVDAAEMDRLILDVVEWATECVPQKISLLNFSSRGVEGREPGPLVHFVALGLQDGLLALGSLHRVEAGRGSGLAPGAPRWRPHPAVDLWIADYSLQALYAWLDAVSAAISP